MDERGLGFDARQEQETFIIFPTASMGSPSLPAVIESSLPTPKDWDIKVITADFQDVCSYVFSPSYTFMAWCSIKHRTKCYLLRKFTASCTPPFVCVISDTLCIPPCIATGVANVSSDLRFGWIEAYCSGIIQVN